MSNQLEPEGNAMSSFVIGEIGLQASVVVEVSIECVDPIPQDSPFAKYECMTESISEVIHRIKRGDEVRALFNDPSVARWARVEIVAFPDGTETICVPKDGPQLNRLPSYQVRVS
jgi:hypothetical protein